MSAASGCGLASSGMNAEGTRFFQQGDHVSAIRRFEKAIATNPRDADSYYNLAATYHQIAKSSGDPNYWSQAENYYNQSLDVDGDHIPAYRGLAVMLVEQNRQEQAFRLLEGWRDRSPYLADPRVELARLYDEFGETGEAERQLLEAVAVDTTHSRARAALGKLREQQGDVQQALANYQIALQRNYAQPLLQARVAALSSSVRATPAIPAAGGTRVVTSPSGTVRY